MSKNLNKWKKRKSEGHFEVEQAAPKEESNNWLIDSLSRTYQRTLGFLIGLCINQNQAERTAIRCELPPLHCQLWIALDCRIAPNGSGQVGVEFPKEPQKLEKTLQTTQKHSFVRKGINKR